MVNQQIVSHGTVLLYCAVKNVQKVVNGIANHVDPDQTAPLGAIRSGSALVA